MKDSELRRLYQEAAQVFMPRETDLNQDCLKKIEENILGSTVLDIACGRGYLSERLSRRFKVTGADMHLEPGIRNSPLKVAFTEVNLTNLPFKDNGFDTVVSAHTLEHVLNIHAAVKELRRVAKKRLIIVLPKQRPYKYTFDLHLHFFPYPWSLYNLLGLKASGQKCLLIKGDWFYLEEMQTR